MELEKNNATYADMYELIGALKRDSKWQNWPANKTAALEAIEESEEDDE